MKQFYYTVVACTLLTSVASAAHADERIRGAKMCTAYIPSFEREYGIPSHLLSAISSTESGRYHDKLKILLPWPWTINVEGKGYYFDSKAEAVAAVKKYQREGKRSIDVGCMQVNLIHHGHAFASIEKAMDPRYNVEYAASFLRDLYESEKSWRKAAAAYHSKTPSLGGKYVARVFRAWETIISRLRLSPNDTIQQADKQFGGGKAKASPVRLSRVQTPQPTHEPVKMKMIRVTDTARAANDHITMIRPDVSSQSLAQANHIGSPVTRVDRGMASEGVATASMQLGQMDNHANIIRLDGSKPAKEVTIASANQTKQPTSGPRFIFTD